MNIGIIGLGLIGGSLGKAFKAKTSHQIFGRDIAGDVMQKAELSGVIDSRLTDRNIGEIDALIYAVTPKVFVSEGGARTTAPLLKNGAVVCDIAGTKRLVTEEMKRLSALYPALGFISTHPMAGREMSGIAASTAKLFEGASLLITPVAASDAAVSAITRLFLETGFGSVKMTSAEEHDKIIAYTSQLAHVVSSCYIASPTAELHHGFSAGSFLDLSRVAKLNADMWTGLFLENKDCLLPELDGIISRLKEMRKMIAAQDRQALFDVLDKNAAKKIEIDKTDRALKK
ncbi:MAG: prephenate dehydrogenase [Clostridiales bacterium]|jgi:prephenate dehydrogenase|nr:prephenate dehydrogenase [Clostridiales bacterium]